MPGWARRALLSNLVLKLLSLALALLLFVLVHSEKQSLIQGSVTVVYLAPSGKTLVSQPPTSLRVGVSGPVSRVQRFRFDEVPPVEINLSTSREGYFKFRDEMLSLPAGLKVSFIRPEGFNLRFEPTYRRELPVRLEAQGQPAEGYRIAGRNIEPARVTVAGPRRVVSALGALRTEPLNLEGARQEIRERLGLVLPPGIQEVTPERVEVTVNIAATITQLVVKGIPLLLEDNLGRSGQLAVSTVTARLEGPSDLLAGLDRHRLNARVRSTPQQSGRVELKPSIEGVPGGVRVLRVQPAAIEVRLAAPAPPRRGERSSAP